MRGCALLHVVQTFKWGRANLLVQRPTIEHECAEFADGKRLRPATSDAHFPRALTYFVIVHVSMTSGKYAYVFSSTLQCKICYARLTEICVLMCNVLCLFSVCDNDEATAAGRLCHNVFALWGLVSLRAINHRVYDVCVHDVSWSVSLGLRHGCK